MHSRMLFLDLLAQRSSFAGAAISIVACEIFETLIQFLTSGQNLCQQGTLSAKEFIRLALINMVFSLPLLMMILMAEICEMKLCFATLNKLQ